VEQRHRALEQKAREAKTNLEARRLTAETVTLADLEKGPTTLRQAVEQVLAVCGTVRAKGTTLVVALPPGEKGAVGVKAGPQAARVCYAAEEALVAVAKRDGSIDPAKVPDRAVLPSGKLEP
jgi:hypothetical protein